MATVIGIRFKSAGKVYYFDPGDEFVKKGQKVIVETAHGVECGEAVMENSDVDEDKIVKPLKKIIRLATQEDLKQVEKNEEKEKEAFDICNEKIIKHGLEMKLVEVDYNFDASKILFYYTADKRVDFRALVKDLASTFKTRIEMRQIGVRDESKLVGGLGICGRPFCCSTFLGDFHPVSIKMAKEQNLSLNPVKISGCCGRLMCCLKYEQDAYEHLLKITPKNGAIVNTPEGRGTVVDSNLLTGVLQVQLDNAPEAAPAKKFDRKEVKLVRDGKIRVTKSEMEAFEDKID